MKKPVNVQKNVQPQEIEVWYVLPAIRKELAACLVKKHRMSQRKAADLLGVTEAAVSQYIGSKRASRVTFDSKTLDAINLSASELAKGRSSTTSEMQSICSFFKKSLGLCRIHKAHDKSIGKCTACFGHS